MSSKDIDAFKMKSRNLLGVFENSNADTGFRIPSYQRPYNWAETHIDRLFEDIIDDIRDLAPDNRKSEKDILKYTFLGEIIITPEKPRDEFTGNGYLIVDGQQRMTTLSLLSCALIEWVLINKSRIMDRRRDDLEGKVGDNFTKVYNKLLNDVSVSLIGFCVGKIIRTEKDRPFPKITCDGEKMDYGEKMDFRGDGEIFGEYYSDIAFFLDKFYEYFEQNKNISAVEPFQYDDIKEWKNLRYLQNFSHFRKIIDNLSKDEYINEEDNSMTVLRGDDRFNNKNIRGIFGFNQGTEEIFKDLINKKESYDANKFYAECFFPYLRICLFAKYLANNVVMAVVECLDQHYAFSIFEKINTSGEPLTALETFKPDLIEVRDKCSTNKDPKVKSIGDEIYQIFGDVEIYVDNFSRNSNSEISLTRRKNISSDIILAFNQYYYQEPSSKKLKVQRNIMKKFSNPNNQLEEQKKFICCLKNICDYREKFWDDPENITDINLDAFDNDARIAKVCFSYFRDMRKTLTIPIMTEAFARNGHNANDRAFLGSAKALAAFTVLWRAYTGGTQGINKKYYTMLGCDAPELKDRLCTALKEKIGKSSDDELKKTWIRQVSANPLYENGNRPTSKFILLCAKDAEYEKDKRESRTDKFLSASTWSCNLYNTIEHIAPQQPQDDDKDSKDIIGELLLHTIGNLILLPSGVNAALSNLKWAEKKKLYKILAAINEDEIQKFLEEYKDIDKKFPKTISDLDKQPRLGMFDDILDEDTWKSSNVKKRSENILTFAFDELFSWLK